MDIPPISFPTYKHYENEVASSVEEAAMDSCKRPAEEERQLVLQNIEKISREL